MHKPLTYDLLFKTIDQNPPTHLDDQIISPPSTYIQHKLKPPNTLQISQSEIPPPMALP